MVFEFEVQFKETRVRPTLVIIIYLFGLKNITFIYFLFKTYIGFYKPYPLLIFFLFLYFISVLHTY